MKILTLTGLLVLASALTANASPFSDLYVDAAATTAHCTGQSLNEQQAAVLAAEIAHDSGEHISVEDLLSRVARAAEAFRSEDCNTPTAQIHIYLLTKVLLPAAWAPAAPTEKTVG